MVGTDLTLLILFDWASVSPRIFSETGNMPGFAGEKREASTWVVSTIVGQCNFLMG